MAFGVATSVPCRDIISCFWRLQLVAFDVATSVPCRVIILDQRKTCHSFQAVLLSQPPFLVATSTFVATSRCCHDITMLSRHYSLSFWLILSCLTCDPSRDLHQISFNFPDVATSSLDCANPKLQHSLTSCFHFCPAIFCTFTQPIAAFFY